ncbi:hypothetical protein [Nonomuraea rhizosphaerae]|uniref:hypothetical protein n=1 Tax=Nonomuraea rhizosphaerae TaxID=2665663 RepID=UPI001C5E9FE6|nr:hypothetical protein [Nonomuraea rhizosphaerae]
MAAVPRRRLIRSSGPGAAYRQGDGKPVARVARDLGISPYTLHNCVQMDRLAEQYGGNGGKALKESEQEEPARLRREKAPWEQERAELEDECDLLQRSVVLWVKEAIGR